MARAKEMSTKIRYFWSITQDVSNSGKSSQRMNEKARNARTFHLREKGDRSGATGTLALRKISRLLVPSPSYVRFVTNHGNEPSTQWA